jgi:hypothetical protein
MGERGVAAYPFTADWGPVNEIAPVVYGDEFRLLFHAENATLTASKIFKHAFKGKPQRVLCYRLATDAAAKGSATLVDADGANSLVIETLYPSSRAFVLVVKDYPTGGKTIQLIENSVKLFEASSDDLNELVKLINYSDYLRVTSQGVKLPVNIASANLTGGNDGTPVTATQYTAFLDAIEADGTPTAFSLDGVTDDAIITTVDAWTKRVRDAGLYITFVNGGPLAWDISIDTANAKSKSFNYRGIINIGNGCDGYSSADMAIFIAARVASIALNRTVTDEVVDYDQVNKKLRPAQRETCKKAGTLVFVQDGDYVIIDEGVNTLTKPGADETIELGKIRVNTELDYISKDLEAFGNEYKKSKSNTQEARLIYASIVQNTYFKPLVYMEVLQPGATYVPNPAYHGKTAVFHPAIDEAYFLAEFLPVDSMEKIYQKFSIVF